jgi:hypothetical protein
MKLVELIVDTDVASFIHDDTERGAAYSKLMAGSCAGMTLMAVAEFRAGVVQKNWGPRRIEVNKMVEGDSNEQPESLNS